MDVKTIHDFLNSNEQRPPQQKCSIDIIEAFENEIGFKIPQLLSECFQFIGNGGFGPSYGVIGIGSSGFQSDHGDLLQLFHAVIANQNSRPENLPKTLLPFCEWGANIYSCVDCGDDEHCIWLFRDNRFKQQPFTLADFFEHWLADDANILVDWGTTRKTRQVRNPANGEIVTMDYRVLEDE